MKNKCRIRYKTSWEKEKLLVQAISPFHTMFSTAIYMRQNMALCGNGLKQLPIPNYFDNTAEDFRKCKNRILYAFTSLGSSMRNRKTKKQKLKKKKNLIFFLWKRDLLIDWLNGVQCHFLQYFSYDAAASTPIHAFLSFFNQYSAQYSFQATKHCRNNGQRWERNESCGNDYYQSSEKIFAEPGIEPGIFYSQVLLATVWAMGLGFMKKRKMSCTVNRKVAQYAKHISN